MSRASSSARARRGARARDAWRWHPSRPATDDASDDARSAQVTVGENENAESAIRRFRKAVMSSGHIQEVRAIATTTRARDEWTSPWIGPRIGLRRGARGERAVAAVDDAPERAMGMRE